jgi:hypothetical protein
VWCCRAGFDAATLGHQGALPRQGGKGALRVASKLPRFSPQYGLKLEAHPRAPGRRAQRLCQGGVAVW